MLDNASIKRLWKAAEALRMGFAEKGYVSQEEIKRAIPHAPEPYRLYLTTALNNDGIIDRDEYNRLDGISNYYKPLLEDLKQQSPLFREFKVLAEKAKVELQARKRIVANAWRWVNFPNVGEQDAFIDLVFPWLSDPQHSGAPLSLDFLMSVLQRGKNKNFYKLERAVTPLIFHEDDRVRIWAIRFIEPQKAIAAAHQRLKKNPDDLYPLLVLTFHMRMDSFQEKGDEKLQRKVKELISQFEERIKKNPSDAKANWALGHLYVGIGWKANKKRIVEFFDKATRLEPNNPRFQFDKAGGWLLTYDIESSPEYIENVLGVSPVDSLKKAVQLDPENLSYLYPLVSLLVQRCDPQASSIIPKVDSVDPGLYLILGACYLRSKSFAQATQAFGSYLKLDLNQSGAEWMVARESVWLRQYQKALLHVERAVRLDPIAGYKLKMLGTTYLWAGNLDKAAECYCKAIEWSDSFDLDNWEDSIKELEEKERYDLVAKLYEAMCKKEPRNAELFGRLGLVYGSNLGNYREGAKTFQKAVELEPNDVFYNHRLGFSYYLSDQFKEALAPLQRAIELDPSDIYRTRRWLGATLIELKKYKEAIPYLEKAIRLDPEFNLSYEYLARCYFELQQYSKAAQVYLQFVKTSGGKEEKSDAWRLIAEAKFKMKDYDGAYFAYEQSLALAEEGKSRIPLRFGIIRVHQAVDAIVQAQQKAEELLKEYPNDPDVCLEYALVLEQTNSRDNWIKARVVLEEKILEKLKYYINSELSAKVHETLARILRKLGGDQNIQKADEYTAQAERLKLQITKK